MTIAELAAALRGVPRTARLLIDTPDGLKELRMAGATHVRAGGGGLAAGPQGDERTLTGAHINRLD